MTTAKDLEIFGTPWLCQRLLFPKAFIGFCSDRLCDVRTKFEVRSCIRFWRNRDEWPLGYEEQRCLPVQ